VKRVAALAMLLAPATARADDVDPAAERAGDANLESTQRRKGLTFQIAAGGAVTLGMGFDETVERGGSLSLRFGAVATPSLIATFEITNMTLLHKVKGGDTDLHQNLDNNFLVGMQYYPNPAAWIRGAVGIAHYKGDQIVLPGMEGNNTNLTTVGPAAAVGAGFEAFRFRRGFAIGFEMVTALQINRHGALSSTALMLDLCVD
jgi:hypothetical protein